MAETELKIRRDSFGFWEIYIPTGGVVAKALRGQWTRLKNAEQAIEDYIIKKNKPKRSYHKSRQRLREEAENAKIASIVS